MKANNPDGGNITASEVPCAVCCSILKKYTSASTMTNPPPIPIIPAKTPAHIPRANPPSRRVFIDSSNLSVPLKPHLLKREFFLASFQILVGMYERPALQRNGPHTRTRVRLFVRVIARPHQRARLHVLESHLHRLFLEEAELVRRVQPRHRQMVFRWSQILPDRKNVHLARCEVPQHFEQFV